MPMQVVEAINQLTRRARALETARQWLGRSALTGLIAFFLYAGYALTHEYSKGPVTIPYKLFLMIPLLPCLLMVIWAVIASHRLRKAYRQYSSVFALEHNQNWQRVSAAAIGPLLEVTLTGMIDGRFVERPISLLFTLLKSVRAEDEVNLTPFQLQLLHELVAPGRTNWKRVGSTRHRCENVEAMRREELPTVIGTLGLLGNSSSISLLERFSKMTDEEPLRQVALQSIEQIRERMRYGPEQMLRATGAPQAPETLLRVASADESQGQDPQQLMRAARTEDRA